MHTYTASQWILFFFFYCFCGWLWESCYVSVRQHRWVNRGFLHGPLLPIYGFGAIIILLATIRVQSQDGLVFLFGMIAATALEYVTGYVMERLFQVRYWDYSHQRFQLNGYICLSSSLAWGVFSVLLVRFVHPPIAELLVRIPALVSEIGAYVLVAVTSMDAVQSFRAAMDLKEVLTRLTEENEELRRLARRAEVVSAFAADDLRRFREKTTLDRSLLAEALEARYNQHLEERQSRRQRRQAQLEEALHRRTENKLQALQAIAEALENYRDQLTEPDQLTNQTLEQRRAEVDGWLERLRDREASIRTRSTRTYRQALRILRGNPSASAHRFPEVMDALRRLSGRKS
jgi:uncharacterized membrane protein